MTIYDRIREEKKQIKELLLNEKIDHVSIYESCTRDVLTTYEIVEIHFKNNQKITLTCVDLDLDKFSYS